MPERFISAACFDFAAIDNQVTAIRKTTTAYTGCFVRSFGVYIPSVNLDVSRYMSVIGTDTGYFVVVTALGFEFTHLRIVGLAVNIEFMFTGT